MRFRRKGTNWEGRPWSIAASLDPLLDEVEAWQPEPRPLDGTVASQVHDQNNPISDHRPTPYSGFGFVRAVDVGEEGPEGDELAEALRAAQDPRTKYVIHRSRIFASYPRSYRPAWTWGPYTGYNPHPEHVHISVYDGDGEPWNLGLEDMSAVAKGIQTNLNLAGFTDEDGKPLTEDGKWGPKTEYAHLQMCLAASFEGITKAKADKRYARGDHGHKASVELK